MPKVDLQDPLLVRLWMGAFLRAGADLLGSSHLILEPVWATELHDTEDCSLPDM